MSRHLEIDKHYGKYYRIRYPFDPARKGVWKAICEYLQRYVPPASAILELGSGYCDFINQISAATKYALDINPNGAECCAPGVTFFHADAGSIPLPDQSVDVVFASNFLEHFTDEQFKVVIAEMNRVLRTGGTAIFVQPNYYYCHRCYWDDFMHVKPYSHVSLPDLLMCYDYAITRVEKRFLPFSFKSRLPRSYLLTKLYLALPWRPLAAQMLVVAQKEG